MGGALLSKPWRVMPTADGNEATFVESYKPRNGETNHLRILLHGPVGAGKSNFINSVDSFFRKKVTGPALTDAISGSSFTGRYQTFKIEKDPGSFYSVIFNDIMGFEEGADYGVHVDDVILALRGHVKEGYKFKHGLPLKEGDEGYNSTPTLEDRVHVLVSIIPADKVSILNEGQMKKMREVRLAASDIGIPQLAILTKVDEACPKVKKNIKNAYKSKYLEEKVEKFSQMLGLPLNCIFLVKNYNEEMEINEDVNVLILSALNQMIHFGEDFLNKQ